MNYKIAIISILIIGGHNVSSAQKRKSLPATSIQTISVDTIRQDTVAQPKIEVPKDRIDTIYYDRNWNVISNKTFANYYRFALYPADSSVARYYKTYYMSGELQGEGKFISMNEKEDAKNLLDGEILSYFKNGNISERCFYAQGTQEGEHTAYYENGNIKEHYTLSDGQKNGIHSSFTEDGKVCRLSIYKDNIPSDYYVVTDMDGNYSKYDTNTGKPIFETPTQEEVQTEYKNGVAWPYYNKNGLIVGASISSNKEIGTHRKIGFFIVNKSMVNVELNPSQIEVTSTKKENIKAMKLITADEYDKKVFKNKKKNAKKIIKRKVVVNEEQESNINANLGASVFNAGTSNTIKAFQERIISMKELIDENRMRYAEGRPEDLGYLERTTVHPGEIMSGFVLTDLKKADELTVKLTVNGITYTYKWENVRK